MEIIIEDHLAANIIISFFAAYACCVMLNARNLKRAVYTAVFSAVIELYYQSVNIARLGYIAASFLIGAYILFDERRLVKFLKKTVALFLTVFVTGALTEASCNILFGIFGEQKTVYGYLFSAVFVFLAALFSRKLGAFFAAMSKNKLLKEVNIECGKKCVRSRALVDSGNMLSWRGSGVLIVKRSILCGLDAVGSGKFISVDTVNGSDMREVYILDSVRICDDGDRKFTRCYCIAGDIEGCEYGVIMPMCI